MVQSDKPECTNLGDKFRCRPLSKCNATKFRSRFRANSAAKCTPVSSNRSRHLLQEVKDCKRAREDLAQHNPETAAKQRFLSHRSIEALDKIRQTNAEQIIQIKKNIHNNTDIKMPHLTIKCAITEKKKKKRCGPRHGCCQRRLQRTSRRAARSLF